MIAHSLFTFIGMKLELHRNVCKCPRRSNDEQPPRIVGVSLPTQWKSQELILQECHILMATPLPQSIRDALEKRFVVHRVFDSPDVEQTISQVAGDVRAVVTGVPILVEDVSFPITGALMERLPRLEIVVNLGVGYDNIDIGWAAAHGISVTNTPDVLTEETADTAIGLLLNAAYGYSHADRVARGGSKTVRTWPTMVLAGRTIGILGLGRIGQAIARRAEAFGMHVVYHNRNPVKLVDYPYVRNVVELAERADVLMIALPGGPDTHNLVDREVINALGRDGILINIARGSVIDEPALVEALRSGAIRSAGLDVFANEPHVSRELRALDNVVLLPHVGSATHETREAMNRIVVDNLVAWADGADLLTPVSETPWKRPRRSTSHGPAKLS
jgi:lactate dehydrogenase-like 2-hydroxyacid dehydrogenase